ncbi:hypothetical protein BO71DRAFT_653 [Aspergillus ellipticus CBS 707.79]|uniref:Uncharacterized protein n=1 Tax=Aspergillus ellipticus CBS 707.79 TaxID=1448320 RepID=A0A319E0W6_9EURO|nr:hypothetical protein BO71DRAFT_653 [Aspergillus ellipticus CBS 707.79]
MPSLLTKATLLLTSLTLAAATPLVSYAGYYYENCTDPSITTANIARSACVNVENFPINSFTAYIFSGACDDSATSPVLSVYTASGCSADDLVESVEVTDEKTCFAIDDVTAVSLGVECV